MNEFVGVHVGDEHPGIGTIVVNRPPTNTITRQVCRELITAAAEVSRRAEITAVIVFGGHEVFSAGDDMAEMRLLAPEDADLAAGLRQRAVSAIAAIPKPTAAAITGYALGSGLGLALAADRRISGDNAKLGCTDILAGLAPGSGLTARLPRLVGVSAAKELAFSGRFIDAKEALAIGLIDEMVSPDGVYDAAVRWADRFAEAPAGALAAAKAAIDGDDLAAKLDRERGLYAEVFAFADRRFVAE